VNKKTTAAHLANYVFLHAYSRTAAAARTQKQKLPGVAPRGDWGKHSPYSSQRSFL